MASGSFDSQLCKCSPKNMEIVDCAKNILSHPYLTYLLCMYLGHILLRIIVYNVSYSCFHFMNQIIHLLLQYIVPQGKIPL